MNILNMKKSFQNRQRHFLVFGSLKNSTHLSATLGNSQRPRWRQGHSAGDQGWQGKRVLLPSWRRHFQLAFRSHWWNTSRPCSCCVETPQFMSSWFDLNHFGTCCNLFVALYDKRAIPSKITEWENTHRFMSTIPLAFINFQTRENNVSSSDFMGVSAEYVYVCMYCNVM